MGGDDGRRTTLPHISTRVYWLIHSHTHYCIRLRVHITQHDITVSSFRLLPPFSSPCSPSRSSHLADQSKRVRHPRRPHIQRPPHVVLVVERSACSVAGGTESGEAQVVEVEGEIFRETHLMKNQMVSVSVCMCVCVYEYLR